MHGTPWFHATNIPNAPPTNLVQIGVGGWTQPRDWDSNSRERRTTIMTMEAVDRYGAERVAEYALDIAWKQANCVVLSFDVKCVDPASAPGSVTAELGGPRPAQVFMML